MNRQRLVIIGAGGHAREVRWRTLGIGYAAPRLKVADELEPLSGPVNLNIGPFSLVNIGCTIGHETELGRACSINPGAHLSGGIKLGKGVLVGTGAQTLQYLEVEDLAIVGAGAVVTKSLPGGVTAIGMPARVI